MADSIRHDGIDPLFTQPYVDLDEWRDVPVRHRYVHGGFADTETRFSIYFPPASSYEGRFFQHITPVPDSEHLAQGATGAQDRIGFAVSSGGSFLETNGGGASGRPGSSVDPTIAAYRANAASARFSRTVAAQMYGEHRPYGYAYGGSGGGYRTIGSAENTSGVWDGFVPYVIGSPMAIPNMFTVRMHAQRILRNRFDQIVDAVEPGGSCDMFEGLDAEERNALTEVTRMGFPPRSWFGHRTMGMHAFPVLYRGLVAADPTYFEDFWTKPGYLGYEPPPSLRRDRVTQDFAIVAVVTEAEAPAPAGSTRRHPGQARGGVDTAWRRSRHPAPVPIGVRLSGVPRVDVRGADLSVRSGAAAGARVGLLSVVDDVAVFGPGGEATIAVIRPGDTVTIDNSGYLAAETYHRHQVPEGDGFEVWDQFRNPDGSPIYPQRPLVLGPLFAAAAAGSVQSGRFEGKMIVVESLLDREAFPWQADWYRNKVREHLGDAVDDRFRLWFTDNALHGDDELQESPLHTVSYLGVQQQALRDLSRWVEEGVAPPASTSYEVVDGQVAVPAEATRRRGIQPVVSLTVNGGLRADGTTGEELTFRAVAAVPEGTGMITEVAWDFDGSGDFLEAELVAAAPEVVVERRRSFPEAGTSFPAVRVVARRDGMTSGPFARLQNLARVRVVVGDPPRGGGTGRQEFLVNQPHMATDRLLDMVGRPGGPLADAALWHLEVIEAGTLSPSFRRVVVTAPGIEGLQCAPGQDLMLRVPQAGDKVVNRRYTIRNFDSVERKVVVDVSLHGKGPGTDWITGAAPGDRIDAIGPRGKITLRPDADWHLFVVDETGMPGTLAMIEALPAGSTAIALLEVDGPADEQEPEASRADRLHLHWLHRSGRSVPGDPDLVLEAVAHVDLPAGAGHVYVAAEAGVVRGVTRTLTERGLQPDQISGKAYWRRGLPNAEHGEPTKES